MKEVWVFHGASGQFTSGVFASQLQAEEFITRYPLTGCLTKYPVGISAYDWAIQEKSLSQPSLSITKLVLFNGLPTLAKSIIITTPMI